LRVIVYTGKGGVGKTTVAASTALRAAKMGYRTIVISTDAAHSLADSFDIKLGPEPVPIGERLWGQEIDVYHEVDTHWGTIQRYLSTLFAWQGVDSIVAEEMTVPPGINELASLLQLVRLHDSGEYDLVVVDSAPTGEALELLTFPEVLRWWMEKLFPIQRRVASLTRPVVRSLTGMPMPGDEVFDAVADLYRQLARTQKLLGDPTSTSIRVVLNAEKMVILEAQRLFMYSNLYGYPVDLIVCNRVIPESVTDSYFQGWKASQAKYIQMIEERFAPVPIRYVPLMENEVVGVESLEVVGRELFGDEDPTQVYHRGRSYSFERAGNGYNLLLPLPFTTRGEVELSQVGDELVVRVGNQRRTIILPRTLAGMQTSGARLESGTLTVRFAPQAG
jgi:arsenite/tail-anchored protein-transporting ATPase